jgi:Carboxymuconolactone decarboxylase family
MARVPYVQREQLTPEQQQHFDAIAGSRGRVGPNFQALLNSPEAGGRFAAFGEYVRFHGDVPERLKELAIITAAREANNDYVWTAHERLARQQGVTDPKRDPPPYRPRRLEWRRCQSGALCQRAADHARDCRRHVSCHASDAGQQGRDGLDFAHPVLPLPGPRPASRQAGNAAGHPVNAVMPIALTKRRLSPGPLRPLAADASAAHRGESPPRLYCYRRRPVPGDGIPAR